MDVTEDMAAAGRRLGKVAYDAYRATTGGHSAVTGAPLPEWEDQAPAIREAWEAAAAAVRAAG